MFFKNLCILVLWTEVASALEGLNMLPRGLLLPSMSLLLTGVARDLRGFWIQFIRKPEHNKVNYYHVRRRTIHPLGFLPDL